MTETKTVDGIEIRISYAGEAAQTQELTEEEIKAYISRAYEKFPHGKLNWLGLDIDGEDVGISYGLDNVPFDRIRRITGYLVGTMDRWNDAKTAEETDRVKHQVPASAETCTPAEAAA